MADGKYSLDDILNEYSSGRSVGSGNNIDVDDILGSYEKKSAGNSPESVPETHADKEKISLHNTDIFNSVNSRYDETGITGINTVEDNLSAGRRRTR